ncbi:hypothetical protein FE257_011369 [Aspergillus nanangensis]|uniref:Uncharacterized protein n=1 Tax=Aspergillus nanangensis TaxID=2582783 RepID=A0AAD4CHA0_ASPNN|nr:hypothetical protein FE257_011369 [Aspergillus nanangensis]
MSNDPQHHIVNKGYIDSNPCISHIPESDVIDHHEAALTTEIGSTPPLGTSDVCTTIRAIIGYEHREDSKSWKSDSGAQPCPGSSVGLIGLPRVDPSLDRLKTM